MATITISPASFAIVTAAAAKRGVSADEFVDTEILAVALPLLVAGVATRSDYDQLPSDVSVNSAAPEPDPKMRRKKKRRKLPRNWSCPCCGTKYKAAGNKLHFLSCATKAGLTVREIALFCHGDTALARMYGCTPSSTVEDIEAGIRHLAASVHFGDFLREESDGDSPTRQRLTAKARFKGSK